MSTAAQRGWGPGWPNCQESKIAPVEIPGMRLRAQEVHGDVESGFTFHESVDLPAGVREEIADLTTMLCIETQARGYDLVDGWCWGFACRPIKGVSPAVASNHSWGLAVDLNAPTNPMGSRLVTDMPAWMPALWRSYMFGWGGDYSGRKDAMHYEFLGTPADARRLTILANERGLGVVLTPQQQKDLARLEGFNARLDGKPEPKKPSPQKRGWNDARELQNETK